MSEGHQTCILCGKIPWKISDKKCVLLLYISKKTANRRYLTQKLAHEEINHLMIVRNAQTFLFCTENIIFESSLQGVS